MAEVELKGMNIQVKSRVKRESSDVVLSISIIKVLYIDTY